MIAEACYALTPPGPANSPADSLVRDLVGRARNGDKQAWDALVERYAPLIWSICRRHRLGHADADDVGQSVWLRLVDQLDRVASRPMPYADISAQLGIPVGSIGPTRSRYLDKMRRHPAIAALRNA